MGTIWTREALKLLYTSNTVLSSSCFELLCRSIYEHNKISFSCQLLWQKLVNIINDLFTPTYRQNNASRKPGEASDDPEKK